MSRREETSTYIPRWGLARATTADLKMVDRIGYSKKELAQRVAQAQEDSEEFGRVGYWLNFPTGILMIVYSDIYVPGSEENREWIEQLIRKRPKKRKSPKNNPKKAKGVRSLVSSALK